MDEGENIIDKAPTRLERVRLLDIRESTTALRPVDRTNPEYLELLASVKEHGVIETITVRECEDEKTHAKYYGLINGLQRFNAAKDAGMDDIDVKVIVADDMEVLVKQIILNAKRVETKPVEYSNQLKRIVAMNPQMTLKQLAAMVSASEKFISERLSLLKLNNDIAKFVDDGTINLTNAYALAKLPANEQLAFKDRAIQQTPQEFCPQTAKRAKELNEANRKGLSATPEQFEPTARLRKLDEMKGECEKKELGKILIEKTGITDALEAFYLGLRYALHLDPISVAQSKAKYESQKKEAEEAKQRRAAEKLERENGNAVNAVLGIKVEEPAPAPVVA